MRELLNIPFPIIVEGKYDRDKLDSIVNGRIITTDGFGIFKKQEKMALLRALAEKTRIIVLSDSDGAGKVIRSHISSAIPKERLIQVYTPRIEGKEKRKAAPGKEGKLGVEGMTREVILESLRRAGATIEGEESISVRQITKQDLMELGLSGGADASAKRLALLKKLDLPEHMSANAMLQALNLLVDPEELKKLLEDL